MLSPGYSVVKGDGPKSKIIQKTVERESGGVREFRFQLKTAVRRGLREAIASCRNHTKQKGRQNEELPERVPSS